jgi:peptide/nickel transport system permease protein
MTTYLIRRFIMGVMTLGVITMLVYALIRHMPGTPLMIDAEANPDKQMSKEDYELIKKTYGLDSPWHIAYFKWLGNVVRGDLGTSFRTRSSVLTMIGERIGPTLLLSVISLVLVYVLSIPLGLFASARSGSLLERVTSFLLYGLYSLPAYVAGIGLLYIFYLKMEGTWFHLKPNMVSDEFQEYNLLYKFIDICKHLIMPLICYSYSSIAYDVRFIKANMEEAIRQDYIRTARAKGLGEWNIILKHAFRNTLIPFVTLLGLTLPGLIGGAIIIEQIFNWPGVGTMFYDSINYRDYPVVMGVVFMLAIATLAGQLLADVLYAVVDPRVTYQ